MGYHPYVLHLLYQLHNMKYAPHRLLHCSSRIYTDRWSCYSRMTTVLHPTGSGLISTMPRTILASVSNSSRFIDTLPPCSSIRVVSVHGAPIMVPMAHNPYPLCGFSLQSLASDDSNFPPGFQQLWLRYILGYDL